MSDPPIAGGCDLRDVYRRQMAVIRGLRDRHLADVDDARSLWRPRPDLPPIAWHAAHASLFTAITLCGMGRGDWSFATADEIDAFNYTAALLDGLPPISAVRARIAAWDAASDAVAAAVAPRDWDRPLPQRRDDWLPATCVTWSDAILYMVTHEPFHHGEIGVLRRIAGHARVE